MQNLSFQKKLLFSMAGLLLVALFLLSLLAGNLMQREVSQAMTSEMYSSLEQTRTTASQWVSAKVNVMRALATQLPAYPNGWEAWEERLTLGLDAGDFDLAYVGTPRGDMVQSQPPGELPAGYDPRTRPWYQAARAQQDLVITPPYVDAVTGDLVITMALPLAGEPDSILGADLLISGIVKDLLATQTRWTTQTWMLDQSGQVLAHPNQDRLQQNLSDLLPGVTLQSGIQTVEFEGSSWLLSSIEVPEAGWTFLLLIDATEVNAGLVGLTWQLLSLSLLVILVSCLVLYQLTHSLSKPLVSFQLQLKQISQTLDLSQRIDVRDQAELGDLAKQTNHLLERLSHIIQAIFRNADNLSESAGRLAHTAGLVNQNNNLQQQVSQSMAAAVEQMSSSVAEITSTMEELSASSTQIADHSQSVVDVANLTLDSSKKGAQAMQQLLHRMTEIQQDNAQSLDEIMQLGAKSKQISKVMDLINTLADQTKLIAFNAALEASSAGDSGKRFSVVASEIRRLADSVTDSTLEIEDRIQEIQDSISRLVITSEKGSGSIQSGMDVSAITAEDLNALVQAATKTSNAAQQISLSTKQQKTASSQVVIALRDIANASTHNAQSVRSITEISEEMVSMSAELNQLVHEFRLANHDTKISDRQDQ
ncbi:methyl-accepting chemotaxis protein [Nitrincola iocasae]|uniref:HAMP domain-containing protein n=1 Tax=Nitrincola iocasae TaxID=2614693 RepID=A0A5J6LHW3_9GAMM|nr:methyl-accepting chemotaxis protein [Nitrincola iocasae]QEW08135.1 HAMP domain-containing protein [Nitrincola iocasae]